MATLQETARREPYSDLKIRHPPEIMFYAGCDARIGDTIDDLFTSHFAMWTIA
jgi:hypothetical protein